MIHSHAFMVSDLAGLKARCSGILFSPSFILTGIKYMLKKLTLPKTVLKQTQICYPKRFE